MPAAPGSAQRDYLRAKPRIGSCNNPVSYAPEVIVFHHDDIPDSRRARVQEVKAWASSQLLSTERRPWTKTTKPDVPICERRQAENAERNRSNPYAYNYRAETLEYSKLVSPIDRPTKFRMSRQTESQVMELTRIMDQDPVQRGILKRTEEMPVHPNLVGKTPWDNTMVLTTAAQQASLDRMTVKSRQSTKRVNEALSLTRGYVKPAEQVRQLNARLREEKKHHDHHQQQGTAAAATSSSSSSSHGVEEELDRRTLRNRQAIEPSRKYSTYHHSGTWEFNAVENRFMWSDTGSFVYESRGDVKVTRDPDRYNLESVDMPRVRLKGPPFQPHAHQPQ